MQIITKTQIPISTILLGNKIDVENGRSISQKRALSYAQISGIPYFEVSAKEGIIGGLVKLIISLTGVISKADLESYTKQTNILLNRDELDSRFFSTEKKYHYPLTIEGQTVEQSNAKWESALNLFFEISTSAYEAKKNDTERFELLNSLLNDIIPFSTKAKQILDIPVGWAIQLTVMMYLQVNPRARQYTNGLLEELSKLLSTGNNILQEIVRNVDKLILRGMIDDELETLDKYIASKIGDTGPKGPTGQGGQSNTPQTTPKPPPLFGSVGQKTAQVEVKLKQQPLFGSKPQTKSNIQLPPVEKPKPKPLFDIPPLQKSYVENVQSIEKKATPKQAPLFSIPMIQKQVETKQIQMVEKQREETKPKPTPLFNIPTIQKPVETKQIQTVEKQKVETKLKPTPLFNIPIIQKQVETKQIQTVEKQKEETKLKPKPLFTEFSIPMVITKSGKTEVQTGITSKQSGNKPQQQQSEDVDLKQAEFNSLKTRIEELEKMLADQKSTMLTSTDSDAYGVLVSELLEEIEANKKNLASKKQPPKQKTTYIKLPKEIEASLSHVVSIYDYMLHDTLKLQKQSSKRLLLTKPDEFDVAYIESTAEILYHIFKWEPHINPIASVIFNAIYHISNADPGLFRKQAIPIQILNYNVADRSDYIERQFLLTALLYNNTLDDIYSDVANKLVDILKDFYKTLEKVASELKPGGKTKFGDREINDASDLYNDTTWTENIIVGDSDYYISVNELSSLLAPFILAVTWIATETRSFCKHFIMHIDPGVIPTVFYMIDYMPNISAEEKMMLYNCVALCGAKYFMDAADLFMEKKAELGDQLYGILASNFRRIITTSISEFVDSLSDGWKGIYSGGEKLKNDDTMFFAVTKMIENLVTPNDCLSMAISMFSRVKFDGWQIDEKDMTRKFDVDYKSQYSHLHFANTSARYYFNHAVARAVEQLEHLIYVIDLVETNENASAAAQASTKYNELTWFEFATGGALESVRYIGKNVIDIMYILHLSGKRSVEPNQLYALFGDKNILLPLDKLFDTVMPNIIDQTSQHDSTELEGCVNSSHKVKHIDSKWYERGMTLFASYISSVTIDSNLVRRTRASFNMISKTLLQKHTETIVDSVRNQASKIYPMNINHIVGPFNRLQWLDALLLSIDTTKDYKVSIEKTTQRLVKNIETVESDFGIVAYMTNLLQVFFGKAWHANLLLYTIIENMSPVYWFVMVYMMSNEYTDLRTTIKQTLATEGPFSEQAKVVQRLAEELDNITTQNIGEKLVVKAASLSKPNAVIVTTDGFDSINFEKWKVIVSTFETIMDPEIVKMVDQIKSIKAYASIKKELKIFGKYATSGLLEDYKSRGSVATTISLTKALTDKSGTLFFTLITKNDIGEYNLTGFDDVTTNKDELTAILKLLEKLMVVGVEIAMVGRFGSIYTPKSHSLQSIVINGRKYIDTMEHMYRTLIEKYTAILKSNAETIEKELGDNTMQEIFAKMSDSDKTLNIKVNSPPITLSTTTIDMSGVNTDQSVVLRRDLYNVAKYDGNGKNKALIWRVLKKMIERTEITETIKKQSDYKLGGKEYKATDADWKTNLPQYIASALKDAIKLFKETIEKDVSENKWIEALSQNLLNEFILLIEKERAKILTIANDKMDNDVSGMKLYDILPQAIKSMYKPMYLNPPVQPATAELSCSQEQFASGFGFSRHISKFNGFAAFS